MDNKELNNNQVTNNTPELPATNNENQISSSIELPEIAMPKKQEHIPTLQELEAQRKAEENQILVQKKENHEKMFNRDDEILYTVEDEKEGNPLVIVGLFAVIALFVLFLQPINTFINKTFGLEINFFPNQTTPSNTNNPTIQEEDQKYSFKDPSKRVKIGPLALTNIVIVKNNSGEYEIDFTIINESEESYIYDKKYYIVLYDDDNILYRSLIHSYSPLAAKAANELTLPVNEAAYKRANGFKLEEISETQYPKVEFTSQIDEYDVLTCSRGNDTMEYYFEDNMLIKEKEKYFEESMDSTNYQENLNDYKNKSENYNNIDGITATFVETSSDFTMISEIELEKIQDITIKNLQVYKLFKYRTNSRTVAFEMNSMGYTCDNK